MATAVVLCQTQNDRTRALILKRSKDEEEGGGLWTIPGGKVSYADLGEPQITVDHTQWRCVLERALAREVFKETCIRAQPEQFVPLRGGDLIFRRKDGTLTLVTTHYLLLCDGVPDVKLGKETTAYALVTEDELERYQFIGDVAGDIRRAFSEYLPWVPAENG